MVSVNYDAIPDKLLDNYLQFLIGKLFKIIPMKECNDENLTAYLHSLQRELLGNKELITKIRYNPNFLSILGKIQYLISYDVNFKICRKEIFDCISLIEKIKKEE